MDRVKKRSTHIRPTKRARSALARKNEESPSPRPPTKLVSDLTDIETADSLSIDVQNEGDRLFDDTSLARHHPPKAVMLMGGVAAGKTTLRIKEYYKAAVETMLSVSPAELKKRGDGSWARTEAA